MSPESETLSGDIFMSKKIYAEIRYQVLLLLRQGAPAQTIAFRLRLTKSCIAIKGRFISIAPFAELPKIFLSNKTIPAKAIVGIMQ